METKYKLTISIVIFAQANDFQNQQKTIFLKINKRKKFYFCIAIIKSEKKRMSKLLTASFEFVNDVLSELKELQLSREVFELVSPFVINLFGSRRRKKPKL